MHFTLHFRHAKRPLQTRKGTKHENLTKEHKTGKEWDFIGRSVKTAALIHNKPGKKTTIFPK